MNDTEIAAQARKRLGIRERGNYSAYMRMFTNGDDARCFLNWLKKAHGFDPKPLQATSNPPDEWAINSAGGYAVNHGRLYMEYVLNAKPAIDKVLGATTKAGTQFGRKYVERQTAKRAALLISNTTE